jgi:hypothetical protein
MLLNDLQFPKIMPGHEFKTPRSRKSNCKVNSDLKFVEGAGGGRAKMGKEYVPWQLSKCDSYQNNILLSTIKATNY